METKRRALGKGLEELFNTEQIDINKVEEKIIESTPKNEIVDLDLDQLRSNPYQPRKTFDEEALQELSNSIKEHGVFQPIIAKKSIKGYEIVAGERRVLASRMAGLDKIPAIVKDLTDEQMMEIALLENLQRENLTSIEEAEAYHMMLEKLHLTQEELATKVGKSRSHITNILGLLRLPNTVQSMINSSQISMGHARILSKLEDSDKILEIANKIVNDKLSVRDVEKLTQSDHFERKNKIKRDKKSSDYQYVEELISEKLDTKVKIRDKKIEISFVNDADLNRILEIIDIKE